MRRLILVIFGCFLLVGFTLFVASAAETEIKVPEKLERGAPAPDFTLKTLKGKTLTLKQLRGKVVLLNFWATWCPACRHEMPSMEQLNKTLAGSDFVMLALNVDKKRPEVFRSFPYDFEVLLDPGGQAQKKYGVYRVPETFVIDKQGTIQEHIIGTITWDDPKVVNYFKSLVGR